MRSGGAWRPLLGARWPQGLAAKSTHLDVLHSGYMVNTSACERRTYGAKFRFQRMRPICALGRHKLIVRQHSRVASIVQQEGTVLPPKRAGEEPSSPVGVAVARSQAVRELYNPNEGQVLPAGSSSGVRVGYGEQTRRRAPLTALAGRLVESDNGSERVCRLAAQDRRGRLSGRDRGMGKRCKPDDRRIAGWLVSLTARRFRLGSSESGSL
jgi:hypothetical protein